jgi:hypothetical protein
MSRQNNYETTAEMVPLPSELWLIVFNLGIEEGIIWLYQCDYTTFPHMRSSLFSSASRSQVYGSYWRLRLVCRRFNSLLRTLPFSKISLLPIPISTRALSLDFETLSNSHFQRLLAETLACGRLVYIDVTCNRSYRLDRLTLCKFLDTGRVFHNVQRLTLRLANERFPQSLVSLWSYLSSGFPSSMTFAMVTGRANLMLQEEKDSEAICFERLEILYLGGAVTYSGCHFPRLQHASVLQCAGPDLKSSPVHPVSSLYLFDHTFVTPLTWLQAHV